MPRKITNPADTLATLAADTLATLATLPADAIDVPADTLATLATLPADAIDVPADAIDAPADAPADAIDVPADAIDAPADVLPIIPPVPQDLTDTVAVKAYIQAVKARADMVKALAKRDRDAATALAKAAMQARRDAGRGNGLLAALAKAQAADAKVQSDAIALRNTIIVFGDMFDTAGGNLPRGMCKALRAVSHDFVALGLSRALFVKAATMTGIDPTTAGCQWAASGV